MSSLMEGRGLVKSYGLRGGVHALRGVSITLGEGEVVALVGPNGAGKTTLLRILAGILEPDAGEVFVKGAALRSLSLPARRKLLRTVGFVPEVPLVLNHLTGREYLTMVAALFETPADEAPELIQRSLARWDLEDSAGRFVRTYSQGMLKKLALAAALLHGPRVLLLDEPLNFLDVRAQDHLWKAVRDIRDQGGAVLLSTHILETAQGIAMRVIMLQDGTVSGEYGSVQLRDKGWQEVRTALTGGGS